MTRRWLTGYSCSLTWRAVRDRRTARLTAGAFAAAIRRERTLPGWLWWLSTVAAVLGVATVTTLLGPANNSSAAYGLLLLGAIALFAWLAASSAVLLGRTLRADDRAIDAR